MHNKVSEKKVLELNEQQKRERNSTKESENESRLEVKRTELAKNRKKGESGRPHIHRRSVLKKPRRRLNNAKN